VASFFVFVLVTAQVWAAAARTPTVSILAPDGQFVAAQANGKIAIWRRGSVKPLATIKDGTPFRGVLTRRALVGMADDGLRVWSGKRYARSRLLPLPKTLSTGPIGISADGRVGAMTFPRDGGVGDPNAVRVWDLGTGRVTHDFYFAEERVLGLAFSADGQTLAIIGDRRRQAARAWVYRLAPRRSMRLVIDWTHADGVTCYSVALSPSGSHLAVGTEREIQLWDLKRAQLVRADSTQQIVDRLFPAQVRRMRLKMPPAHRLGFSPRGDRLYSMHAFEIVGVAQWRVPGLEPLHWTPRPEGGEMMRDLVFQRENDLLLVTSGYGSPVTLYRSPGAGAPFAVERTFASP
jgi:hypothetical protein